MIKNLILSLVIAGIVSGCTTSKSNHHQVDADHQGEFPVHFDHVVNSSVEPLVEVQPSTSVSERDPAAKMVSSGWSTASGSVRFGPEGGTFFLNFTLRQVATYETTYKYTCNQYAWAERSCEDYVCSRSGRSELWDAYLGASRAKKSKALASAIQGISPASAEALYKSNVFPAKPRDWREFRERMNIALERKLITERHYNDVFNAYGTRNRANMGFAGESCRTENYRCRAYGLYEFANGCTGTKHSEEVIATAKRRIQLTVQSPKLQKFESELLVVSSGYDPSSISVTGVSETNYAIVSNKLIGDRVELVIRGVERNRTKLPNAIRRVQLIDRPGSSLSLAIEVIPNMIGHGEDRLILTTQVSHCEPGGLFKAGDCKGKNGDSKKTLAPVFHTIRQPTARLNLDAVPTGHRVWVSYSIHRENSSFYLNTPVQHTTVRLDGLKQ